MIRKSISLGLGAVFVWSLIFSAWGYCPPAKGEDGLQADGPTVTAQETQLTQNRQVKEAHHPCHSLKDPYLATIVRDFLRSLSPDSTFKDVPHLEILFLDKASSHSSGSSSPPINAPPLNSQPLFLLNQSLLI